MTACGDVHVHTRTVTASWRARMMGALGAVLVTSHTCTRRYGHGPMHNDGVTSWVSDAPKVSR